MIKNNKKYNNKKYNNKKLDILISLKSNFNKTNKYFEHFSKIIDNKNLYNFLDYYNIHNNYLNKDITNSNYNTLIHKSYFLLNSKISVKNNFFKHFNNNIHFMNKLLLVRESFELGYGENTINNFNKKYNIYYYTKLFRLKINNYNKINKTYL